MAMTSRRNKWKEYKWKRPNEMWGNGNFKLFDTIAPGDIKQGVLGDCYFLSCLSAIAENEDRIKSVFVNKEVNQAGIYAVHFYLNGEMKTVVVDDYFPVKITDDGKEEWAFSRPQGKEIWVLVLEKAWAKVFGSYSRIECGDTAEAMPCITGCPTQNITLADYPDKGKLWELLSWADKNRFPMCCLVNSA
jgi:calpain-15